MASTSKPVREIPISEFKARCLALVERVRRGKGDLLITKRGKPVAKVVALDEAKAWPPLGGLWAGKVRVVGDVVHNDWSDEFETLQERQERDASNRSSEK